jgi:hypothetical protein
MGKMYISLVGKPHWKSPLGRQRNRWENNIKIDSKELGCEDVDLIHLAQNMV